jgi:hypothetical protein
MCFWICSDKNNSELLTLKINSKINFKNISLDNSQNEISSILISRIFKNCPEIENILYELYCKNDNTKQYTLTLCLIYDQAYIYEWNKLLSTKHYIYTVNTKNNNLFNLFEFITNINKIRYSTINLIESYFYIDNIKTPCIYNYKKLNKLLNKLLNI